ncbi:MAG: GNAT family N-acetyltransferase [Acetobacteraceae bacterium]|nr:GNAT family N-acetyltransferase [Acetobacteraceae bacterium]
MICRWDRGIGRQLVGAATAHFDASGARHASLFTFPNSAKHVGLYQKFGYSARFLTAIMSAPVQGGRARQPRWLRYSGLTGEQRTECLDACRDLTGALHEGLEGFALCHYGPRSEAGEGTCFVKFGAVRPGPAAGERFDRLLDACAALAMAVGMAKLHAGVNMARQEAYGHMVGRGFRTEI